MYGGDGDEHACDSRVHDGRSICERVLLCTMLEFMITCVVVF